MIEKTIDETLELDGQSLTLHDMHGHFCDSCGEGVWDEKSYNRYSEGQEALIRSVRGNYLSSKAALRLSLTIQLNS